MINRKNIILSVLSVAALLFFDACKKTEPYLDTKLSFEERTNDLVSKLTLEEKVQLMRYDSPAIDRLGIPAHNWWNECLHGVARSGLATVFPQAIGMAAMWDTLQMHENAVAISDEARAKHHDYARRGKRGIYQGLTYWTPNINIFRDPRWGRGMETYGEDPYLTAELAIPFIKGMQGDDPKYFKLIATAKHFAVHSGPESTRHSFDVWPNDYDLAETYFPHFKRTVTESGVYSVMCAYQRFKGAPCCGNEFLEDVLRNKWNFKGYIVSDCWAIHDFYERNAHAVTATPEEAAAMAVKAGTDLNCGDTYAKHLLDAVKQGLLTEDKIDISVKRLILARMKLGQFDPEENVKYAKIPLDIVDCEQHRFLALQSARKSMVLLKNVNNILPFSKKINKIAVIGPNADNREVLLGSYNGYPSIETTPLKGIIAKLPDAEVKFAQGCELADGLPYLSVIPVQYFFTDKSLKTKGLKAEYFDNVQWQGTPKHTRIDGNIDFTWWTTPPFGDMQYDKFSVRWKGMLLPPVTGKYAIGGEALNGFRFYLDGKMLTFGKENEHHSRKGYKYVELKAGKAYEIQVEYIQDNSEYSNVHIFWDMPETNLKKEAVELAQNSDLVVLCMGLSPMLEGEEMIVKVKGFAGGDRLDIQLPETQTELIREIQKLRKPTVLVLLNGSALAFNWEAENIPAIIEAWYPGQAGGTAIADVIFGDYNPAGRLPLTFYKDINQIPAFENYDMKGKTYRYFEGEPLYEFGFGLSFTTFEYSIKNIPAEIKTNENIKVLVDVKNTGKMDGDEVVQLYVSLPDSKLKKPIRSLQGFKRIHLKAGETKTVNFTLKPGQFAARDNQNVAFVEPGKVVLSIGGKQPDNKSIADKKVVQQSVELKGDKFFINE
ncbi:MAG: glycoside hydrolase family 3 C-terminal domain-containing protein [Bacteroidales bacterium]|nr:glycoside hydrolase family 3 C-terminal domain-containing protein [Bacteroidales bacterium]